MRRLKVFAHPALGGALDIHMPGERHWDIGHPMRIERAMGVQSFPLSRDPTGPDRILPFLELFHVEVMKGINGRKSCISQQLA
jgi:hypothetical protein